jgi:glycine dehydrogenase subunit 1
MLDAIGIDGVERLHEGVPARLRLNRPLNLPPPLAAEADLKREVMRLLDCNTDCSEALSFLGGGCAQHYVPAICDEIAQRAEFLTAYGGDGYTDHGKYQAFFEFASLIGELVELDSVGLSTYDWGNAAASALRMACRITGRRAVVCPAVVAPERLSVIRTVCAPDIEVRIVPLDPATLRLDGTALAELLDSECAAIYVEAPSYLGVIETGVAEISAMTHDAGALMIVGVDAVSLGVLAAPPSYGADVVCGDIQPLGLHMGYGGGLAGFLATRDEPRFVHENPGFIFGVTPTAAEGELGFGYLDFSRTLYIGREEGKDYTGTATALWAITAAVYLSLAGPQGMVDIGRSIMQRARYAAERLAEIPGVDVPSLAHPFFKEFVVNFDGCAVSRVAAINASLRRRGVFGGHDLSGEFPALGQSALYCVTENHSMADLDRLRDAVADATSEAAP